MMLLSLFAANAGVRPPFRGANAQQLPPSIWLIGESLWMSTVPEQPHTAAVVLTETAAGVAELRFMEQFAHGPRECALWLTDEAHDRQGLTLSIQEIAYEEEYEESAVLRSSLFTTTGLFTVEAQCQYGLFGTAGSGVRFGDRFTTTACVL